MSPFSRFLCASAIAKGNVDVPAEQAALADQLFKLTSRVTLCLAALTYRALLASADWLAAFVSAT